MTLSASELMVRGLAELGARMGLSEGLLGLLTALGADAPELSSALIAILAGSRAVGVGVVLGSNLFNLAALLGVSALVTGRLRIHRGPLILDGAVGIAVLALAGLLIGGVLPAPPLIALLLVLFAAYAAVLSLPQRQLRRLPGPLARAVVFAPGHVTQDAGASLPRSPRLVIGLLPVAVAGVVAGSLGLVHSALGLAALWEVPAPVTGGLVLAVLTSLPNAYAAVQLGRRNRGTAVMSEAVNSNTINLIGGLALPAALLGLKLPGAAVPYWWLLGLTLVAVGLPLWRHRLGRPGAVAVIAGYLGFVGWTLSR